MTDPLQYILSLLNQVEECRRVQKCGDWSNFLGEVDAMAELSRVLGEIQ